jgi:predicted house-cleaning noncanonical NTP pyrophosphatase (MazG superfamily)
MKKEYNKLVRDKILKILKKAGVGSSHHIAIDDDEYIKKLYEKLDEEILEFKNDPCVGELADIMEVVEAIGKFHHIDAKDASAMKKFKKTTRGSFDNRIILGLTWGDKA